DWLMRLVPDAQTLVYPMVSYALAYVAEQTGHDDKARECYKRAATAPPDFCFPALLEELVILQAALEANPQDARAHDYLGNLLYDRRRYEEAIAHWEHAVALQPGLSTPWRNLGIGYYNIHHDPQRARQCYLKAFELNPHDPRLLYELDQLMKKLNAAPAERLARLEQHLDLVQQRDYLAIEQVALYNQLGRHEQALALLQSRRFFPWEGGEGTVSGQYVTAHIALGRAALDAGDARTALEHFEAAQHYPENLGEGKYMHLVDLPLWYFEGLAREMLGDEPGAQARFRRAADAPAGASELSYYRALALRKLGQEDAAYDQLQALLTAAEQQIHAKGQFAYFGTSVANVLLFQEDLHKLNRVEGGYLAGLAQLGLDRLANAAHAFEDVLALDGNHLGAQEELKRLAVLT
ncbi:MAG: tetratricopeptide repeat protein, partial [Chloroflexi bacterium]|nr:tetratricopeptide repeat protein [Chloroflexota bacterium]